ncbi:MAG: hypothetical protein ABI947_18075 [Chloroflexota bacterium]
MLKEILLSVIFIVLYFGSIVLYMTRIYAVIEPRTRQWLGQRLGVKITNSPRMRSSGWTIDGKHTAQHSFIVFFAQLAFIVASVIIPMMGLLTILVALLALVNGGM